MHHIKIKIITSLIAIVLLFNVAVPKAHAGEFQDLIEILIAIGIFDGAEQIAQAREIARLLDEDDVVEQDEDVVVTDHVSIEKVSTSKLLQSYDHTRNESGLFTIKIDVLAYNGDLYVPHGLRKVGGFYESAMTYAVIRDGFGNVATSSSNVTSSLSSTADSYGNNYVIRDGTAESFTANIKYSPDIPGWYAAQLVDFFYRVDSPYASLEEVSLDTSEFRTDFLSISAEIDDVDTRATTTISVRETSDNEIISSSNDATGRDRGEFTINFAVTASDGDAYISRSNGIGYYVEGPATSTSVTKSFTAKTSKSGDTSSSYFVQEGTTRDFVFKVSVEPGSDGYYKLLINSIDWGTSSYTVSAHESVHPSTNSLFLSAGHEPEVVIAQAVSTYSYSIPAVTFPTEITVAPLGTVNFNSNGDYFFRNAGSLTLEDIRDVAAFADSSGTSSFLQKDQVLAYGSDQESTSSATAIYYYVENVGWYNGFGNVQVSQNTALPELFVIRNRDISGTTNVTIPEGMIYIGNGAYNVQPRPWSSGSVKGAYSGDNQVTLTFEELLVLGAVTR